MEALICCSFNTYYSENKPGLIHIITSGDDLFSLYWYKAFNCWDAAFYVVFAYGDACD